MYLSESVCTTHNVLVLYFVWFVSPDCDLFHQTVLCDLFHQTVTVLCDLFRQTVTVLCDLFRQTVTFV